MHHQEETQRSTGVGLRDVIVAVGLVGLALWLRWPGLDPPSLWFDDSWQAMAVKARSWSDLLLVSGTSPLYGAILSLLPSHTDLELTVQLPALAAGLSVPPVLYLGMRRLERGRGPALIAGLIGTTAPILVAYSTRAKAYTLDALFASLFMIVAAQFLRSAGSRRYATLAVLAAVAIFVSGHTAVFYVPVLGWLTWINGKRAFRTRLLALTAIAGLPLAYYLLFLRHQITPALEDYWTYAFLDQGAGFPRAAAQALLGFGTLVLPVSFPSATIGALVVGLFGVSVLLVKRANPRLALLLVLPVAAAIVAAILGRSPFGAGRTDSHLIPVIAIGIAFGLSARVDEIQSKGIWRSFVLTVFSAVLVVSSVQRPIGYPDTSPAAKDLVASGYDSGLIVLGSMADIPYGLYSGREFSVHRDDGRTNGYHLEFDSPSIVETATATHQCSQVQDAVRQQDPETVVILWSHPGDPIAELTDCARSLGYVQVDTWGTEGQQAIFMSR